MAVVVSSLLESSLRLRGRTTSSLLSLRFRAESVVIVVGLGAGLAVVAMTDVVVESLVVAGGSSSLLSSGLDI